MADGETSFTLEPLSTPAVADSRDFALDTGGHLYALDAASGTLLWHHDLVESLGASPPSHGVHTGLLHMVLAIGEGFEAPLSVRVLPPEPPSFTPPSFAGSQIFIRSLVDLTDPPPSRRSPSS